MSTDRLDRDDAVAVDCDVCGRRFDGRDALVDHLEDAHALISTTIERNTRLVFDTSDEPDSDNTRRSRRRDGRAPGDQS